ncbi:MAG: hypothetical protein ABI806_05005 [Candidatus Solibacter sp.]
MNLVQNRAERLYVAVVATVSSFLLLLGGPFSNFSSAGYLDPWYYFAYFTNFRYLVHTYGPNYYVARLPWILPGLLAFKLASPETASVLLNAALMTVSAIALYWAVRWHYGITPAVLACAALATNPQFISAIGWDYPDGPAIAYAFIALAFAVRPHGSAAWNLVCATVFVTLSALTHLSGASMQVSILALAVWRHRASFKWTRLAVLVAAAGGGAVVALIPLSQFLVGRWTYFYWQIYKAAHIVANPGVVDTMYGTGFAFLSTAPRLFAPAFLLLAGLWLLRRRTSDVAWHAWAILAATFALLSVVEFVLHVPTLRVPFHGTYLILPLFFFAGVLLGEMGKLDQRAAVAIGVLVFILPFAGQVLMQELPMWMPLFILSAAMLIAPGPWKQASLLTLLFLAPCLDRSVGAMWDVPKGRNLETTRTLLDFQGYLTKAVDPERRIQFWLDNDEASPLFVSAEALYLSIHDDFTKEIATAPAAEIRENLKPNATLVHLTNHPERMEARRKLLADRGIVAGNERTIALPWATVILQDVTSMSALK